MCVQACSVPHPALHTCTCCIWVHTISHTCTPSSMCVGVEVHSVRFSARPLLLCARLSVCVCAVHTSTHACTHSVGSSMQSYNCMHPAHSPAVHAGRCRMRTAQARSPVKRAPAAWAGGRNGWVVVVVLCLHSRAFASDHQCAMPTTEGLVSTAIAWWLCALRAHQCPGACSDSHRSNTRTYTVIQRPLSHNTVPSPRA